MTVANTTPTVPTMVRHGTSDHEQAALDPDEPSLDARGLARNAIELAGAVGRNPVR